MYDNVFYFYQVKQEAMKMESSSSASHMSPTVCKTSPAGMLIKSKGKIPKKGTQRPVILKFNFWFLKIFVRSCNYGMSDCCGQR